MPSFNQIVVSDILAMVNAVFRDAEDEKFSEAEKFAAIKMAISNSWPFIYFTNIEAFTMAAGTIAYDPIDPSDDSFVPEWGFSRAYLTDSNDDRLYLRNLRQQFNVTRWYIIVPEVLTRQYDTKQVFCEFEVPITGDITDRDTPVLLPLDYAWKASAYYLSLTALPSNAQFETNPYEQLAVLYKKEMEESLRKNQTQPMPRMIPYVHDPGVSSKIARSDGLYAV